MAVMLAATSVAPSFAHEDESGDDSRIRANVQAGVNVQADDDDENDDRGGKLNGWFRGWFKGKHSGEAKFRVGGSLTTRLEKIIAHYDENRDKHVTAYTKLQTNLANFEARVEAAGYDTTNLEAHLAIFDAKVVQFKADYAAYIDALRVAHDMAVNGSTTAEVNAQLQIAKDKLLVAKASGMAARDYYKTTIRADVKALRLEIEADANALLNLAS